MKLTLDPGAAALLDALHAAGCTIRSASGTACPRCKSRHWVTGTPSARAFSGSNLPARGKSSR